MTRREAILAHLTGHPDLTSSELARVIGSASCVRRLLLDMEAKAQVISRTGHRPGQGSREVQLWRAAPPGTIPPPRSPADPWILARRRERDRVSTAARRARGRAPAVAAVPLAGAACAGTDPALFFPGPGDSGTEAKAKAICAACPARTSCYERALQNGERWGVWGGINFEKGSLMTVSEPGLSDQSSARAEAERLALEAADEWDSADSSAYQARVEAGLAPEDPEVDPDLADRPVPYTLTSRAEALMAAEPEPEAGAGI